MIREAFKRDLPSIVKIENEWENYPKWGEKGFLNEFDKKFSKTFVYDDGEIKGFINIWINELEMEINTIVVSRKHILKKIGSMLIEYILELARGNGVKKVYLEVNETNIPAISLYKKFGFEVYGKRKKYYDLKYDAILMKKEII